MTRVRFAAAAVLVVTVSLSVALLDAQRATIPQRLAQGSFGRISTVPSGAAPTITAVLQLTDIIARGVVGNPRSYLSDDQFDVFTDYPILNPVILFSRATMVTSRPGLPTLTATQLGGTVQIGGRTFTQTENGLLPLEPGTEVLLLLSRVGDKYRIAGTFFGAFRVTGGTLTPLVRKSGFAPEYSGVSADDAARAMTQQAGSLR